MKRLTFGDFWWPLLNYAVIAESVVSVLNPAVNQIRWFWLVHLALLVAFMVALGFRLRARGVGRVPLGELYEQAKNGRSLVREQPLETATLVSIVAASLMR